MVRGTLIGLDYIAVSSSLGSRSDCAWPVWQSLVTRASIKPNYIADYNASINSFVFDSFRDTPVLACNSRCVLSPCILHLGPKSGQSRFSNFNSVPRNTDATDFVRGVRRESKPRYNPLKTSRPSLDERLSRGPSLVCMVPTNCPAAVDNRERCNFSRVDARYRRANPATPIFPN